ncbi:MAG: GNAT family N-acetyltransferase [Caldilineaceae bacterium]
MTKTTDVKIVRASASHAARLTQIAHAAKSYWGYPAHWIELWRNQLTISPAFIEANEVWAAVADDAVQGFYALTGVPPQMTLDHMWVMPASIGQGIGAALYGHALGRAAALGGRCLEIEADPNAEPFYQRMGAVTVGEVSYMIDGLRRALPLMEVTLPPSAPAPAPPATLESAPASA